MWMLIDTYPYSLQRKFAANILFYDKSGVRSGLVLLPGEVDLILPGYEEKVKQLFSLDEHYN
jgi:hypothetical protein